MTTTIKSIVELTLFRRGQEGMTFTTTDGSEYELVIVENEIAGVSSAYLQVRRVDKPDPKERS